MKRLWVAAALAPLSFAASAHAQVTISNGTSTPIATATANNGQPADIVIASGGSVNPTTAGTAGAPTVAVTLNSNNSVTNNGTIQTSNLANITGIQALGGFAGTGGVSVDNTGAISLTETASQHANGTNGIADGIFVNGVFPNDTVNGVFINNFAQGDNRFGILVTGASPLVGTLTNSGSITIVGEFSAGISIGAGGLTGDLIDSGTITTTGDSTFGIISQGLINGNVRVTGAISSTGQAASALVLNGGATGQVEIGAAIAVTGFHSTTAPAQTTTLLNSLEPQQLVSGGPAVSIGGSVGGGVSVDAAVAASASGVTPVVTATTGGSIVATGSTALLIGGGANAAPITIGANATSGENGSSLFIGGGVSSAGAYNNFNATGVQIGSANGASVALPGGIDVTSSISASTVSTAQSATDGAGNTITGTAVALHLMPGVSVAGGVTVGAIGSTGGGLVASSTSSLITGPGNVVTALQIDNGVASGITLNNYGTISASIGGIGAVIGGQAAAGGQVGTATAISDKGGAITTILNEGAIIATITPIVALATESGTTVALDQSQSVAGSNFTLTQKQADVIAATSSTSATTPAAPSITGDVLFGAGNANLNLYAGTLTGAVSFGTGTNSLDIENGAVVTGALTETQGGSLALSVGTNGNNAVASTLNNLSTAHIGLSTLNIGASGQVLFTIDPGNGAGTQFTVAGAANLAAGAKIGLNIVSANPDVQTFTLITAGSLNSATSAQLLAGQTPFLFNATLTQTTGVDGSVSVTVSPRTAAQLGLNAAETAAYAAVFDQLKADQDATVTNTVLSKTNRADFIHIYDQFLPDFEGGPFDTLVVGQAQIAQAEADTPIKLQTDGARGWVQEIGYLDNRQDTTSANGYRAGGFGIIAGYEEARGDSAIGVTAAFVTDGVKNDRQGPGGAVSSSGVEGGIYWRDGSPTDGLDLHASVNGGYLFMSNHRLLFDEDINGNVTLFREAKSQWNGATVSAELGASYQIPVGRFYIRPEVIADYVYLYESAFSEHGGGPSEDLAVAARNSEEGSVQGDLVIGADLGGPNHWRPEVTLGWREVVSGGPGNTTARFISGGPSFTLSPAFDDKGSIIGRVGVRAGGNFADFSADAGGQYSTNYQVYSARAVARFLF